MNTVPWLLICSIPPFFHFHLLAYSTQLDGDHSQADAPILPSCKHTSITLPNAFNHQGILEHSFNGLHMQTKTLSHNLLSLHGQLALVEVSEGQGSPRSWFYPELILLASYVALSAPHTLNWVLTHQMLAVSCWRACLLKRNLVPQLFFIGAPSVSSFCATVMVSFLLLL